MKLSSGTDYRDVMVDPTGDSDAPVIRVRYPAGHWRSQPGGTLFYAYPYNTPPKSRLISNTPISNVSATIEYEGAACGAATGPRARGVWRSSPGRRAPLTPPRCLHKRATCARWSRVAPLCPPLPPPPPSLL